MKYGDLILSEDKSIVRYYVTNDESQKSERLTFLKEGTFVFQRPDTKKLIIEIDGQLLDVEPTTVYPLNEQNVDYFKELIGLTYEKGLEEEMAKKSRLTMMKETIQEKVHDLQRSIEVINEKNRVEHSENRQKSIRGLEKSLRKKEVRIKGLESRLGEQALIIEIVENEYQRSLDQVDKDFSRFVH